jgi:hypothetical protein
MWQGTPTMQDSKYDKNRMSSLHYIATEEMSHKYIW